MIELRPFQKRFLKGAMAPGITKACLSLSRGNGKSHLAAFILKRALTPGDPWHVPGAEYLLLSGSLDQARQVFNPLIAELEESEYRTQTSTTRMGVHHKATGTTLRVVSSKAKTAFGLGANNPIVVADEPGVYEVNQGQLMNDALDTALGKPDADMRVIYIGTLAPALPGGWWPNMVADGSYGSTFVQALVGDPEKWDQASEIRRCNPLMWHYRASRKVLFGERDAARSDSRLLARFRSFRLNCPSADSARMLLDVDDWQRVVARPVPPREGAPTIGVDLGAGRAWHSAVAIWDNGRTEAVAVAPGLPDLEAQEKRDRVPRGTYSMLQDIGSLDVADGLRVQPVKQLVGMALERWGQPQLMIADRARFKELQDSAKRIRLESRVTLWFEAAEDVRALRKMASDGPLSVAADSEMLIAASLAAAMVQNNTAGGTRLVKRDPANNTGRDDVASALTLCAGAISRKRPRTGLRSLGLAG